MTALPFHAVSVIIDGQIRLRIYRGSRLEIELPLRQRRALVLAADLLNHALMVSGTGDARITDQVGDFTHVP